MARYISRDPFARETMTRSAILDLKGSCSWCGTQRKDRHLYQYWIERDGINTRPHGIPGLFCSKGCMEACHA
jgi:YgiT-type zinc finger domain-containing protein